MKETRYIALFIALLLSFSALAQKENQYFNYSAIGIKVGGNYSTIGLQPAVANMIGEMSYTGGLVYAFSNKKNVGIQIEALFSSRKWSEEFIDYNAQTELQYVELPFMTNINLGSGRFKYVINLGAYFALNINKNLSTDMPMNHEAYEALLARKESNGDFGLLLGGALKYLSKVGIFQLDARFTYGYQKIYKEEDTDFRYSNMSVISVGLIYMLNLRK